MVSGGSGKGYHVTDVTVTTFEGGGYGEPGTRNIFKKLYFRLRAYFTHKKRIKLGVEGELSKIQEEFHELSDAHGQQKGFFSIVECADLVTTVGMFSWKQYRVPFLLVVLFAYLRKPYKAIRNPILKRLYGKRSKWI
jgi:hypothetical protein